MILISGLLKNYPRHLLFALKIWNKQKCLDHFLAIQLDSICTKFEEDQKKIEGERFERKCIFFSFNPLNSAWQNMFTKLLTLPWVLTVYQS